MLHVPSMEGLGRCWWKAMALPFDTRRQTTTQTNGPGCEVQAQSCRPQAAPQTDCAAQNAGAKRPCGADLSRGWPAVNPEALKLRLNRRAWLRDHALARVPQRQMAQ